MPGFLPARSSSISVTVKGYDDKAVIVANCQIVASHERLFKKHTLILDLIHYLATLGKKPGELDHSPVFRDRKLPACFTASRAASEQLHGAISGSCRFAQALQLLGEHPISRVTQAIEACQRDQLHSAELVVQRTRSLAVIDATKRDGAATPSEVPTAPQVDVPLPDLSRFNQLLSSPPVDGPVSVIFA